METIIGRYDVELVSGVEGLSQVQRERAEFGIRMINLALEELGYRGSLPRIFFFNDLVVNGVPRVGCLIPEWEQNNGCPALLMEVGSNPAGKAFTEESIAEAMEAGLSVDQIQKLAIMSTFFEEAYHWVEYKAGWLPKGTGRQGILEGYDSYYDQPHEKRASAFAQRMMHDSGRLVDTLGKLY